MCPKSDSKTSTAGACRARQKHAKFQSVLESVKKRLARQSSTPEVQAYVAQVLTEQHQEYSDSLAAEIGKRQQLLKYVDSLEVRSVFF